MRGGRRVAMAAVVALVGAVVVTGGPGPTSPPPAVAAPTLLGYTALAPCRIVNTVPGSPLDASGPGATRTFQVTGSAASIAAQGGTAGGCGVPVDVRLVELAVTVVGPSANGYLRAYATGDAEPTATFMNFVDNVSMTSSGPLPLSSGGQINLTTHGASIDVVVEVLGYFDGAPTVALFDPTAPCRVYSSTGGAPLAPNASVDLQVAGTGAGFAAQGGTAGGCGVPEDAVAAELVLTAVDPTSNGYARLRPTGQVGNGATVLNYRAGRSITNGSIVPLAVPAGPDVTLTNLGGTSDFVVDVVGYWRPGGGYAYEPRPVPCRAVNTVAVDGELPTGGVRAVQIAASGPVLPQGQSKSAAGCGVFDGAAAVVASVSAVAPNADGYLRAWPAGSTPPNATFMNFQGGESITATGTLGLAPVGTRDLVLKSFSGSTDVVVDVLGVYRGGAGSADLIDEAAPGLSHTCVKALGSIPRGNVVLCVGRNGSAQLGDGTLADRITPVAVTTLGLSGATTAVAVASLSSGFVHSCLRDNGGVPSCWGGNSAGQVGAGAFTANVSRAFPVKLLGKADGIVQVAAGGSTSCLVSKDASARCWGDGTGGQLGNGTSASSNLPVPVNGLKAVTASIAPGLSHTCALLLDSTVRCWGSNQFGQLGDGTTNPSSVPVAVSGLAKAVEVRAGAFHTCAILLGGGVRCWGKGLSGQLGNGAAASSPTPVAVTGISDAVTLGTGGAYSCVTTASGQVRCWGANQFGQLGDGTTTQRNSPVAASVSFGGVTLPIALNSLVATGFDTTCAISTTPKVRCWGRNAYGQVGDTTTTTRLRPVPAFEP